MVYRQSVLTRADSANSASDRDRYDPLPISHNLSVCGRYRLSLRKQLIEEYFARVSGGDEWSPRYNSAPTQPVPIISQNPKEPVRELSLVRWGLILSWSLKGMRKNAGSVGELKYTYFPSCDHVGYFTFIWVSSIHFWAFRSNNMRWSIVVRAATVAR